MEEFNQLATSLRQEQQAVIRFLFSNKNTVSEMYAKMLAVYGDDTLSRRTVYRKHSWFREGCASAVPSPSKGRPVSASTDVMWNTLQVLIEEDPSITQRCIATILDVSKRTVQNVLHFVFFMELLK